MDCPFRIGLKVKVDGSYIVTIAQTEHSGHEISEEDFKKYRKARQLTKEQEDAVLATLTRGGKLPEIGQMLTDFTGRQFKREDVHNLVKKLQKQHLVVDAETGEEKLEFRGVQVAARGLGLSQTHRSIAV